MTKEDYMKLSKERLAELLVERDLECTCDMQPQSYDTKPSYDPRPLCGMGGYCTNPHRDCIGCPGCYFPGQEIITTTNYTE